MSRLRTSGSALVLIVSLGACTGNSAGTAPNDHNHDYAPTGGPIPDPTPVDWFENLPESKAFALGVMSGDVTADSVIVWTRYQGTHPVDFVAYAQDTHFGIHIPLEKTLITEDGVIKFKVPHLLASTPYRFSFLERTSEGFTRSAIGTTRTAFASHEERTLRFIASGDVDIREAPFTIFDAIAREENIDHMIVNGDWAYPQGATHYDAYAAAYQANLGDPHMQIGLRTHPVYVTWDDHEVANDWDPESVPPEQVEAARRAFLNYTPINLQPDSRIWRNFAWGKTAEFFVLDCRSERQPSTGQYVSPEQMTWLKEGLQKSEAAFKFIINSVPIAEFHVVKPEDAWEGYPDDRSAILNHIASNDIRNVYWLSADLHAAIIATLPETPGSRDFVTGPLAHTQETKLEILGLLPNVEFIDARNNNYFIFEADPMTEILTVLIRDKSGRLIRRQTFDGTH